MAHNSVIFLYYDGIIVEGSNGCGYDPNEPVFLPEIQNGDRDYNQLCFEINEIIGWPENEIKIRGRYPYPKDGEMHFRPVKIRNNVQFVKFAAYVKNIGWEIELYLDRVRSSESHIGTSSRSNNEIESDDQFASFDRARVSNNLLPELDADDDENEIDEEPEMGTDDEEEIYEDGEQQRERFEYTEEGQMESVGTFGDSPAAEFEDSSMWEYARNDVMYGTIGCEKGDEILYKGQKFETKSQLQSAVRLYSVKNHREIVVDHSSKMIFTVVCKLKDVGIGCNWRLHASVNKQGFFEIKTYKQPHVCINQTPKNDHKQLTSALIGGLILDIVRADLSIKPVTIIESVKLRFDYTVSYWKAWHAKQHAVRFLFGGWKEAYNLLPELMWAIIKTNPETRYFFKTGRTNDDGETEFESLFWAFGPSLHGFQFCKPVLTVDGTFLTGKYKGCLLTAIATDANGQLFPLAFALVEGETNDTWAWFFECLRQVIGNRTELCVISDRHAGIISAMRSEYWKPPYGYHRYCMRHLQANFSNHIKDKTVVPMLVGLVCAHNKYKFQKIWKKMAKQSANQATDWLARIDTSKYALSHDEGGRRWGATTSNNAEVMNFVFKGVRKLPVTAIVMATFYKLNSYHVRYREKADMRTNMWPEELMKKMEKRCIKAGTYKVTPFNLSEGIYEVVTLPRHTPYGIVSKKWTVNLTEGNCECQKPMIYHCPCSHVIAVCSTRGNSHEPFINPYYSLDYLKRTYEKSFYPIQERSHWDPREHVFGGKLVPGDNLIRKDAHGKMKRGRRQEKRYHNSMDTMNKESREKHCSVCKTPGHTKPTCTQRGGGRYRA